MKKHKLIILFALLCIGVKSWSTPPPPTPNQAYLFAYNTDNKEGHGGIQFAWSSDQKVWHPVGDGFIFLRSDYGRWGSQKRMFHPFIHQSQDGTWHAVWTLNKQDGAIAYASSKNLVDWQPQAYPILSDGKNCLLTEIVPQSNGYTISWASATGSDTTFYASTTKDFKTFGTSKNLAKSERKNLRQNIKIGNTIQQGTIHQVAWEVLEGLEKKVNLTNYRNQLFAETTKEDASRFAGLKPLNAKLTIDPHQTKEISDMLMGIFFEDINYAADGGIYAELVQNRGFEYQLSDREGDQNWNSYKAWALKGNDATFNIETATPIHANNPHYALLTINKVGAALQNEGFDGIALKANEKYDFSLFAKVVDGKSSALKVRLIDENGNVCGETQIKSIGGDWKKYQAVITSKQTVAKARLEVVPQSEGKLALDMISLFPQKTFKGHKNGLREDLAQVLADMKPRFVRFPGGCVAHGDGINNIYNWKNTVGELEARKPQRNLWGYHQSAGLGYYEYFQFCEDIQAEPVPIVAAGVPCQNSAHHGCAIGGQQGGIPMEEMGAYIQDVLDLIEWANGNPKTSKWAKMRADAGHPKPFNLKYIGIGNEDLISEVFEERFKMIFDAVKEKHPDVTVIGTAGPFSEGSDYERGWAFASEQEIPILDEHYYQPPAWYIYNQDFYDRYDRNKSKVYLGEYAAHLPGRPNNLETALAEALHLISCERNGDVVHMTSYAPLLAKEGHTQWNPDLIYFNNTEVKPTVGYEIQKLFGEHAGDEYIFSNIEVDTNDSKVSKRIACSVVKDSRTNDVIVKLVNLLPTEVALALDTKKLGIDTLQASKIILTGKTDDKKAMPTHSKVNVAELNNLELPAYSFTLIRFSK
ncbi:alpha-L-arabinofuranosidase C-terminal domain-containing protein [Bacteroides propionicifaciens]|uniref:alpha-L-arabinofuranosidase C-terminal domain-containing protein n=1 Tax=Bacteroides propionicifaciens TaxID=392838 RepID=UPI00036CC88F|nr:alpha-L-arabinofuranosidase C-terminal domain-containing protein [Bacteroides propionicifaciens]